MDSEHHRGLERVYAAAACNRAVPSRIAVGDGEAEVLIDVDEAHFHGAGALHGHVLFKALDDAAFFAANAKVADELVLTASFHVHFLRPVREGVLRATGRVLQRSRKLVTAESRVVDDRGRVVASGSGSFVPSGMRLDALEGYRA